MVRINLIRYEFFIAIGAMIMIGSLIKLFKIADFSSDWFWFLAGLAFVVEGVIFQIKQRKFDRKYKIIEKHKS
jgi:predicted membrane channel-forming protein YqfA (hemolysin III family)